LSVFKRLILQLARWTQALPRVQQRIYSIAKNSRLTAGWGNQTTSEDTELSSSLVNGRNRARALTRDAPYAKRARTIVQNNVIGTGIGMQAKVVNAKGDLDDRVNDGIEEAWESWCGAKSCHTGGELHFSDLERVMMGQIFDTGEVFARVHNRAFGPSLIPIALELIEPERVADEFAVAAQYGHTIVRLGVETDEFHRPVAYFFRSTHPGDLRLTPQTQTKIERVPAQDIFHPRIIERWPSTRAMPWMHAVARKLNDMDATTEAEITAARGAACYMGFIENVDPAAEFGVKQEDGTTEIEISPATVERLGPNEKFNFAAPNRPNSQLDPFMRMMLREVAAGIGCSYESLSRDYSQSNYSSSRLALLDDRDLWRVLQLWFIRMFRMDFHKRWLQAAVLSGNIAAIPKEAYALNMAKYEKVSFKPRGWGWIDPTKEVDAYAKAIEQGFTTVTHVIAQTGDGRDIEDVLRERAQELKLAKSYGIELPTFSKPEPPVIGQPAAETADEGKDPAVIAAEKMLKGKGRYA